MASSVKFYFNKLDLPFYLVVLVVFKMHVLSPIMSGKV